MQSQLNLMEPLLICSTVRRLFLPIKFVTDQPTLSGRGSDNVSLVPFFSPLFLAFAYEFKGVVAVPNIRGGSEFGTGWSDAGVKAQKMNAVNDFISATFVVSPELILVLLFLIKYRPGNIS